jgi:hypothetical protein
MKISMKALRDDLHERLILKFRHYGLERGKDRFFYKKTESGEWAVGVGWVRHPADFDASMNVSVRINALEEFVYENESEQGEGRFTFGAEIGNISQGRNKRWRVCSYADLDPVSESITEALETIGIPYLEKYSDMETALAAISGDDKDSALHSPVAGERAKRAIALAFVLKKFDVFRELADYKARYLESRNNQKLGEFLAFRKKLEDRLKTMEEK